MAKVGTSANFDRMVGEVGGESGLIIVWHGSRMKHFLMHLSSPPVVLLHAQFIKAYRMC